MKAKGKIHSGRPAFFDSPEEFEKMCEGYYKNCLANEEPLTITGLTLYLGFESRQSFYDYEKREGYSYTVKKNRLKIENSYEKALMSGGNPSGPIFALKNFGWTDRQETHVVVSNELSEEEITQRLVELDRTMNELDS